MSIFTHTTDTAIDRFPLEDGVEIAVGYDHDAESPFYLGDSWVGMAIRPTAGGAEEWYGDKFLGRAYEKWIDFQGSGLTKEEAEMYFGFETENPGRYETVIVNDLYGGPKYEVIISNGFWDLHGIEESDERAEHEAKALAHEFGHWETGAVYLIEITYPDGEVEYRGDIYEDITQDNVHNYI